MKMRASLLAALLGAVSLHAEEELPKHAPGETFDFEPKLMLDGPLAKLPPGLSERQSALAEDRIPKLEAALLKAENRAADCEQLHKEGVISTVEAEDRMIQVLRAKRELAVVRAAVAAHKAVAAKKAFDAHQQSQTELDDANKSWLAALEAAKAAAAELHDAELNVAVADLNRRKKLMAEGIGSRQEVARAQDRLALLTGTSGYIPPVRPLFMPKPSRTLR